MQRLYVRLVPDSEHISFYVGFRTWIDTTFAGTPDFEDIMQRDEQHDFGLYPTTPSAEELESLVNIETSIVSDDISNNDEEATIA